MTRSGRSWEKKQKNCDELSPGDEQKGDQWDHTAIDVESRLVVSLVVGKRSGETLAEVVSDFAFRTGGTPPRLTTTDDCSTYEDVLLEQYGELRVPERTGLPGRPRNPRKEWPADAVYATVNKTYKKGGVTAIERKLVHGTDEGLARALQASSVSRGINTSFVERQNGTDRTYNARKARKTYEFSKELVVHLAVGWFVMLCYNFHHLHRGLQQHLADGMKLQRTPAMAGGLADRPWTIADILTWQVVGFTPTSAPTPQHFRRSRSIGPAP